MAKGKAPGPSEAGKQGDFGQGTGKLAPKISSRTSQRIPGQGPLHKTISTSKPSKKVK